MGEPPGRGAGPGRGGSRGPHTHAPPDVAGAPGAHGGPGYARGGPGGQQAPPGPGKRMRADSDAMASKRANTGGSGGRGGTLANRAGREVDGTVIKPIDLGTTDPRPVLLFEVSGVLCNSTTARMATAAKNFLPRSGLRHLARLLPKFRLGMYTSAQERSVITAMGVVTSALRGELATWPDAWKMLIDGTNPVKAEAKTEVRPRGPSLHGARSCAWPPSWS